MSATDTQLELDFGTPVALGPIEPVRMPAHAPIRRRFEAFHALNPHVYLAIVSVARHVRREHGLNRCGVKAIFEQLRWQHQLATRGDAWKLNNNYTAEYARLVMLQEPDLADFFETRELKRRNR